MAIDDIVLLQRYPHLSETSDWLVVETGGATSRAYIQITGVTDPATYIGNLLTSPDDDTIITEGIEIKVPDATANEFAIGYSDFADVVDGRYFLDGTLLG